MSALSAIRVCDLHRYPVKGLSPERLDAATLETRGYFPGDRLYAIENGPSGFDERAPRHLPKVAYLMLMRDEALACLRTRYDDATTTLTVEVSGREGVHANLSTPEGRSDLEAFLSAYIPGALRGQPRVLKAPPGYRFTDSPIGFVSLINRASVQAVEAMAGALVDPLRFRGNLTLDGLAPWAEFDLLGAVLASPDGVQLRVTTRTQRCAATNVDPQTGARDLAIPRTLDRALGHADCGVYAEVVCGGTLRPGDALTRVA